MYQLSYISRETQSFSAEDLAQLLETARRNNAKTDLTGMLVYHNGTFLQDHRRSRRRRYQPVRNHQARPSA